MKFSVRRVALDAMLIAMFVVLHQFVSINLPFISITTDSLPVLVAAVLLGPADGFFVGLLGRLLCEMFSQYGLTVTSPLWILPAALRGLAVGFYAKRHAFSLSRKQLIFITVLTAIGVTALNSLVMAVHARIFGYEAVILPLLIPRIVSGVITAVAFSFLLPPLIAALNKNLHLRSSKQ